MKKTIIAVFLLAAIFAVYFLGSGIMKESSVVIDKYVVADDGAHMKICISVSDSTGYVRRIKQTSDGERLYLDFISAFGGINGRVCAKDSFNLDLSDDIHVVSVYRSPGEYEDVLRINSDGKWQKID